MCETHDGPSGPRLVLRPGPVFHRFVRGMHHAVAAKARQGNDLIFDDVIYDPVHFRSYLEAFDGVDVWFVGGKLPLHVAEEHERQRGDCVIGHARGHFDVVHCHGAYDIKMDTEAHTARECAEQIVAAMQRRSGPVAFAEARAQLGT